MLLRPSVLVPVDFSGASRGALRYAAAIAEHFYASLSIVAVDELLPGPVLSRADVDAFVGRTFPAGPPRVPDIEIDVRAGRPALEIRRAAREREPDLIVMSTHGIAGLRNALFGSTTERVLRETITPVLVTPPDDPGPPSIEALKDAIRRVLVPVDLGESTRHQVRIARGLAEAFDASLVLLHVVEPRRLAGLDRPGANAQLEQLRVEQPARLHTQIIIGDGDAAERIASEANARDAGLIVMGLHSVVGLSPRMGSVTYRVLCRVARPVLALPPALDRGLAGTEIRMASLAAEPA